MIGLPDLGVGGRAGALCRCTQVCLWRLRAECGLRRPRLLAGQKRTELVAEFACAESNYQPNCPVTEQIGPDSSDSKYNLMFISARAQCREPMKKKEISATWGEGGADAALQVPGRASRRHQGRGLALYTSGQSAATTGSGQWHSRHAHERCNLTLGRIPRWLLLRNTRKNSNSD